MYLRSGFDRIFSSCFLPILFHNPITSLCHEKLAICLLRFFDAIERQFDSFTIQKCRLLHSMTMMNFFKVNHHHHNRNIISLIHHICFHRHSRRSLLVYWSLTFISGKLLWIWKDRGWAHYGSARVINRVAIVIFLICSPACYSLTLPVNHLGEMTVMCYKQYDGQSLFLGEFGKVRMKYMFMGMMATNAREWRALHSLLLFELRGRFVCYCALALKVIWKILIGLQLCQNNSFTLIWKSKVLASIVGAIRDLTIYISDRLTIVMTMIRTKICKGKAFFF